MIRYCQELYCISLHLPHCETRRTSESQRLGEFPPLTRPRPSDIYHTFVPMVRSSEPPFSLSENSSLIAVVPRLQALAPLPPHHSRCSWRESRPCLVLIPRSRSMVGEGLYFRVAHLPCLKLCSFARGTIQIRLRLAQIHRIRSDNFCPLLLPSRRPSLLLPYA